MNVTPGERENDCVAKRTGERKRGAGDRRRRRITLMDDAPCETTL